MKIFLVSLILIFAGCVRAPIKNRSESLRFTHTPVISDDMAFDGLEKALRSTIDVFNLKITEGFGDCRLQFGPDYFSCEEYKIFLEELLGALEADPTGSLYTQVLREKGDWREVYGNENWGEVFITSYYQPIIQGSDKKTAEFSQALYRRPEDLILIDMSRFAEEFSSLKDYHTKVIAEKSRDGFLRGRIEKDEKGIQKVVPYYSRRGLEQAFGAKNKKDVLVWVRPVDAFFLQIQGSGIVALKNKEMLLGYADQNGHPYYAIGKALLDKIPLDEMSMQRIEAELHKMGPEAAEKIMNMNPSYVFFQEMPSEPLTAFTAAPTPGRTIATDIKYFPKGALAFLEYEKPQFDETGTTLNETKKATRFVVDQDVGGAIRGPGRVDLFWGRGEEAKRISGLMRHSGRLFYITPKRKKD